MAFSLDKAVKFIKPIANFGLGVANLGLQYSASQSQRRGQEQTNATNIMLARENRAWQEYMYRNRHQMEVADLYAAGLNPVLSAKYGGGQVPTGSVATVDNPRSHYANTSIATAQQLRELSLMFAQKEKIEQETDESQAREESVRKDTELKGRAMEPRVAGEWIRPGAKIIASAATGIGIYKAFQVVKMLGSWTPAGRSVKGIKALLGIAQMVRKSGKWQKGIEMAKKFGLNSKQLAWFVRKLK